MAFTEADIAAALADTGILRNKLKINSAICYAFMQASGMVNDHLVSCYRHTEVLKSAEK